MKQNINNKTKNLDLEICIITYNSGKHIWDCLSSIHKLIPEVPIHVIDNASQDRTLELLKNNPYINSLTCNKKNMYVSKPWNNFMRSSKAKHVFFINPDVVLMKRDFIDASIQYMNDNPNAIIAGEVVRTTVANEKNCPSRIFPEHFDMFLEKLKKSTYYLSIKHMFKSFDDIPLIFVNGSCMICDRQEILKVGGFPEDLFYYNDAELSLRLEEHKKCIVNTCKLGIDAIHFGRGSQSIYVENSAVMNYIVFLKKAKNYLEIGLDKAKTFSQIIAPCKIGVDPKFSFNKKELKGTEQIKIYEETSDKFFQVSAPKLKYDVIFIDRLHTYEQSLRDLKNSLKYLNDDGVIIIHDCNPGTPEEAIPAKSLEDVAKKNLPNWQDEWCGDVWKTIVYIQSFMPDLEVLVLDCKYGFGIVRRGKNKKPLAFTKKEIKKMTYYDLEKNRRAYLNLVGFSAIFSLFKKKAK